MVFKGKQLAFFTNISVYIPLPPQVLKLGKYFF
jgi:hypothetical protein